uniref:Uncharacterized protein n=1 Tax=Arundo donax TaxID=35708 RepID=A0A0A9EFC4_ARUDO
MVGVEEVEGCVVGARIIGGSGVEEGTGGMVRARRSGGGGGSGFWIHAVKEDPERGASGLKRKGAAAVYFRAC